MFRYNVTGANGTCLLASMGLQLNVTYEKTDNTVGLAWGPAVPARGSGRSGLLLSVSLREEAGVSALGLSSQRPSAHPMSMCTLRPLLQDGRARRLLRCLQSARCVCHSTGYPVKFHWNFYPNVGVTFTLFL